jgi:cysteine synthase
VPATQGVTATQANRTERHFATLTADEQTRTTAEVVRFILFSAGGGGSVAHTAIAKSLKELAPAAAAILVRAREVLLSVFGLRLVELRTLEHKEEPPLAFDQFAAQKPTRTYVLASTLRNPAAAALIRF